VTGGRGFDVAGALPTGCAGAFRLFGTDAGAAPGLPAGPVVVVVVDVVVLRAD
jgi:hypothetical protein